MEKYYFTQCIEGDSPFQGGWVEVLAPDISKACERYEKTYGLSASGGGRYAFIYSESQFKRTSMAEKGNLGKFCFARLIYGDERVYSGSEGKR